MPNRRRPIPAAFPLTLALTLALTVAGGGGTPLPGPAMAQGTGQGMAQGADPSQLAPIEAYLDGLRSLHGRFLQIGADGRQSQGEFWLQRPGRMRFQYDPPSPLLLVAGHGLVVFHDGQLGQTSNIPLGTTPLGLLLADRIRLSGDVTATDFRHLPGQYQLTLTRTAKPQDGSLSLVLADSPLALRSWTVTDAQRQQTRVSLFDTKAGGGFDQGLFSYVDPGALGSDALP